MMASKRDIKTVLEEIKHRERMNKRSKESFDKNLLTPDTDCGLVIDEEYDDNIAVSYTLSRSTKKKKKELQNIKFIDEPVDLTCEWLSCKENFKSEKKFTEHLLEHSLEAEIDEEKGLYLCCFGDCQCENNNLQSLVKHVSFHAYHERLKNIGKNVADRCNFTKCTSDKMYEVPAIYADYMCEWHSCNTLHGTVNEYLLHIKLHLNELPKVSAKGSYLYCGFKGCKAKFSSQSKLSDHVRSHTKEKVVACHYCGNMFASKTKLNDHTKRQIPAEMLTYQCSTCCKLFSTERLLRDHMRGHINNYKCSMCDMTCSKPSMLAIHIRFRHVNERPFKCHLCAFATVTKMNLEDHLTTHCPDKLMACEECDFSCRSFYGLEKHYIKKHGTGDLSQYECHLCQKTFSRGGILTKHLTRTHDYTWPAGHSRFKYREEADGKFRLQTVRYESLEATQDMMAKKQPLINDNIKYDLEKVVNKDDGDDTPKYVLTVSTKKAAPLNTDANIDEPEDVSNDEIESNIIITIDDVDFKGNVIKSETIEQSKEISKSKT
ncbi:PREDICTED: histone H4 transcription factor [Nicrophorus vespilloides]|uniref:Histone H4 transcription factor n=1 Tax=Nicrophorus vespilloides TaxID=110193 RepID=A0ABM1M829_NICVS|nr:PREDICTED: histone H4 transcription factor [Nicrophorus vespilloides]